MAKLFVMACAFICLMVMQPVAYAEKTIETDVVIAKQILLKDDNGNSRAGIISQDGHPVVFLTDDAGVVRAFMSVAKGGPNIVLANKKGEHEIFISYNDVRKRRAISLGTKEDDSRIVLMNEADENSYVKISGKNGKGSLGVLAEPAGAKVSFIKGSDQKVMSIGAFGDGMHGLALFDDHRDPKVVISYAYDSAFLKVHDRRGSGMSMVSLPESGARLGIYRNGRPIWTPVGAVTEEDLRIRGIIKDMAR